MNIFVLIQFYIQKQLHQYYVCRNKIEQNLAQKNFYLKKRHHMTRFGSFRASSDVGKFLISRQKENEIY